jgi:hypothetical protein
MKSVDFRPTTTANTEHVLMRARAQRNVLGRWATSTQSSFVAGGSIQSVTEGVIPPVAHVPVARIIPPQLDLLTQAREVVLRGEPIGR